MDVTIKRTVDKKLSITITDNDERTALTDDVATGVKWIEDSKTWQDVFKVKQYEYMEILINGGVPIYDKEQKCYIDKRWQGTKNQQKTIHQYLIDMKNYHKNKCCKQYNTKS